MTAELTRRFFFKLAAGAAVTPVLAKMAVALPAVPVLYGDGINDDTAGMRALFAGESVEFGPALGVKLEHYDMWSKAADGWHVKLPSGHYRIEDTVEISDTTTPDFGEPVTVVIADSEIVYPTKERPAFFFSGAGNVRLCVDKCHFRGLSDTPAPAFVFINVGDDHDC